MKQVTIMVTDKMAAKLKSLALRDHLRTTKDGLSYRAFELACMAQPCNDGIREIEIDGRQYLIGPKFSYGSR